MGIILVLNKFKVKKNVLNSITTLKRYCKATKNAFFNNKKFDDDKYFLYLYDRFFVSNQNFTTKHVKIV